MALPERETCQNWEKTIQNGNFNRKSKTHTGGYFFKFYPQNWIFLFSENSYETETYVLRVYNPVTPVLTFNLFIFTTIHKSRKIEF